MNNQTITAGKQFPKQLLHPRYWLTWFAVGIFYLISLLPVSFLDWVGVKLGRLLAKKNRKRRKVVITNLKLCFPDKNPQQIELMMLHHFEYLMRGIMHYGLILWASETRLAKLMVLDGFERVTNLKENGDNVIILLSHCTGLEFAVAAVAQQFPSSGPYKPLDNPVLDWLVARARQRYNDGLAFTRDDGLRPIIKLARQGRVIIYLADEDLGPEVSIFAPLFGINKATIPVLGRLAHSCRAKVLPAFSCYDASSHKYHITLFAPLDNYPTLDQQQDTELMNQMIETTINSCPEQYFWTLKLFKTRPEGEAACYQ